MRKRDRLGRFASNHSDATSSTPPKDKVISQGKKTSYWMVWTPNGRKAEHRLVMEAALERKLLSTENVHHINGDGLDNRLENLQVLGFREHMMLHQHQLGMC